MSGMLGTFEGAVAQGVLWAVMVLGVYITYKILDIADLTVDGSFSLGGCTCAALLFQGVNPVLSLFIGFLAGLAAGAVTGILHTLFEIPAILAGILTQISLWPINYKIMDKANQSISQDKNRNEIKNIFMRFQELTGLELKEATLVLGLIIAIVIILILYWFFGTELGSSIRATGNNPDMIRALGVNIKITKLLTLMLSNGLVALSGALVAQNHKYGDINMGTGAIVIGLAAIVIGEVLLGWIKNFGGKLFAAVLGSSIYFLIRAIVLELDLGTVGTNWMKLISAVIIAAAMAVPVISKKIKTRRMYAETVEEDVVKEEIKC